MLTPFFRNFLLLFIFSITSTFGNIYTSGFLSNLPPSNEHFTGRQEILEQIQERFNEGDYVITLVGFLGIGKTQIARKFAEQNNAHYDIVWFIDAKGSIVEQLRGLAALINDLSATHQTRRININAQPSNFLRQIHAFLNSTPKRWLLVLDNVQERGDILDFLPLRTKTSQGNILITTRSDVGWEKPIRISNFTSKESLSLLKDLLQTNSDEQLDKLAVLLFNHPLSLVQAGCYIRKHSHMNAANYMTLFRNQRKGLWEKEEAMIKEDKDLKDLHDTYQMTGGTALHMSLEELKQRSPLGLQLLFHSALLHSTEIPADVLSLLSKALGYDSVFEYNDAILELTKRSLLEKDRVASRYEPENSLFNMHDLTQVVLLDSQTSEAKKQILSTNLEIFTHMLSGGWDKIVKELTTRPYLLAHIESLCNQAKELKLYNSSLIELMTYILEYHMYHTRDQRTYEKLVKDINALLKETTNVSPLILARFYSDRVYARSSGVEGEELFHKKVIQDYEKALQILEENPSQIEELFRAYMNFAQYYFLLGQFENAKVYIEKAEDIIKNVKSNSYKNLFFFAKAWLLCEMEEYKEAHQSINEAIKGLKTEETTALQIYIKNMKAWADLQTGDYEGAYLWAVKARQEALDFFDNENTDSLVWSTLVIGVYKKRTGDLQGAESAVKESLVRLEAEYGGPFEVTDQACAHTILGDIYVCKGNLLEAKKEYQIAKQIYNKLYSKKEGKGISELYVSFAILGAKLHDDFLAKHYFDLHKKYYGANHKGTQEILQYFRENNVDML